MGMRRGWDAWGDAIPGGMPTGVTTQGGRRFRAPINRFQDRCTDKGNTDTGGLPFKTSVEYDAALRYRYTLHGR